MPDKIVKEVSTIITARDDSAAAFASFQQRTDAWAKQYDKLAGRSAEKTGGGAGFAGLPSSIKLAGVTAAFDFIGRQVAQIAAAGEKWATSMRTGEQSAAEGAAEFTKSLPVIGQVAAATESVIEMVTGIKAQTEMLQRAAAVQDAATEHARAMAETSRVTARAWAEAVRDAANRGMLVQASGYAAGDVGRAQSASVRQENIAKQAEDQERSAREATRQFNEGVQKRFGNAILNGNQEAVAARDATILQSNAKLNKEVAKIRADSEKTAKAEAAAAREEQEMADIDNATAHENAMGQLKARKDAQWYSARGQSAKAAQIAAAEDEERASRDAYNEMIHSARTGDKRLLDEKTAAFETAKAARIQADEDYSRTEKYITEDRERAIAKTSAEAAAADLARTGQVFQSEIVLTKAAYDEKFKVIEREAAEEKRKRPQDAADIERLVGQQQRAAMAEQDKLTYQAHESEISRREGMQSQLSAAASASLQFQARIGMPGAALAANQLNVRQEYARRRQDLERVTRDRSASAEEKSIASQQLAGLGAEEKQAMAMAGFKGLSSGLSGTQNSMFGTGIVQAAQERAANGIDRMVALDTRVLSTLEQLVALVGRNAQAAATPI